MGVDYRAIAVLGIEIPKSCLYKRDSVPQCEHVIPSDSKFCPQCGTLVRCVSKDTPIKEWNPDREMLGKYRVYELMNKKNVVVSLIDASSGSNRSNSYHGISDVWVAKIEDAALELQEYLSNLFEMPSSRFEILLHAIQDVSA